MVDLMSKLVQRIEKLKSHESRSVARGTNKQGSYTTGEQ